MKKIRYKVTSDKDSLELSRYLFEIDFEGEISENFSDLPEYVGVHKSMKENNPKKIVQKIIQSKF